MSGHGNPPRNAGRPGRRMLALALAVAAAAWSDRAAAEVVPAPGGPTAVATGPHEGASPAGTVSVRGDRLTVVVSDLPLETVIARIAAASGAALRGSLQSPRSITAEFADLPLRDGLSRLLGAQNFLLTYGEDGRVRGLTLLGAGREASPTSAGPAPPGSPLPAVDLLQHSVPVGGALRALVGHPTATLQQLLDIALRQDDAALRGEAVRTATRAIDTQPDLRATVVESLRRTDDRRLAHILRALGRDRAPAIVSEIASSSRTPEIRARGLELLRVMRDTAPPGAP